MSNNEIVITIPERAVRTVDNFSRDLQEYLTHLGLPAERILVDAQQRGRVIQNLPDLIAVVAPERRIEALYLSKFVAACAAGLFDAALNFLWDEVVANLRLKVVQFDLQYFFDTAVINPQDRRKYSTEEDLRELDDWSLVKGCQACGIISEIGYRHLDYIRGMRNWASAAHPNQAELTGYQLISWLETCILEVLNKPVQGPVIEVRRLLRNLREQVLTQNDVAPIVNCIGTLGQELATALLRSMFGLFTDPQIQVQVRNNILLVVGAAWSRAPEDRKYEIGLKYSSFAANGDILRRDLARNFLDAVAGLTYLPEGDLALEIQEKTDALSTAHYGWDNFYHEVPAARELRKRIPANGRIPVQVATHVIKTVVLCRMGNGYGMSRGAISYYDEIIQLLQDVQIKVFLELPLDLDVSSRLGNITCARRFKHMAQNLRARTPNLRFQSALDFIETFPETQMSHIALDARYQRLLTDVQL